MNDKLPVDSEQAKLWNGPSGQAWIDLQDALDRALHTFEPAVFDCLVSRFGVMFFDAPVQQSGWIAIQIRPIDVTCMMSEIDLGRYVARLGPVGRALRDADEPTRARVSATLHEAFAPFVHTGEARFATACWMIEARAPRSN